MRVAEYIEHDALGLAALIRSGEVTSAEVIETGMAAVDSVSELNALARPRLSSALDCDATGTFAGIPFALKDLGTHAAGLPQTAGSRLLGSGIALDYDSYLMERFREAGLAVIGTTACPEFGLNLATEPMTTGPVLNPWDLSRSTSGSSGGSAALVAARALPMAHANDGGGSIRCPASACGLVGLKPTRGRISPGPDEVNPVGGFAIEFGLTRTLRDCAALLDSVHGNRPGDEYLLPAPNAPWLGSALQGLRGRTLRIGVLDTTFRGEAVDPSVRAVVHSVASEIERMGHAVEFAAPSIDVDSFESNALVIWAACNAEALDTVAASLGMPIDESTIERTTRITAELGRTVTGAQVIAAQRELGLMSRRIGDFFTTFDVLLTPTMAVPNVALGSLNQDSREHTALRWLQTVYREHGFTPIFNASGNPALSLPLGMSPEGWPIGVQFVAAHGDEATLFGIGHELEIAMPWAQRRPSLLAH